MNNWLEKLSSSRRFGMKPGLGAVSAALAALGDPQKSVRALHIAGTNGKGAVAAVTDAALRRAGGGRIARYTSPHLVCVNERFFIDGEMAGDEDLAAAGEKLLSCGAAGDLTYFEILTAAAFLLFREKHVDLAVLECGLGGRYDATNVCVPEACVITNVGLDHCAWLGDTVGRIAAEKAGIVKPGVPVVLGENAHEVIDVVSRRAKELGAPFIYAPDVVTESDIPAGLALKGRFNRDNARTALAALDVLGVDVKSPAVKEALADVVWPGRFHETDDGFIVDGAHNPPAARALAEALGGEKVDLVAGFCADKSVGEVLSLLAPSVVKAYAVATANERSLPAAETAAEMTRAGMDATACASLDEALDLARESRAATGRRVLVCGSLFLAGEALVKLGAYPWRAPRRFDEAELLFPKEA